MHIPDGFFDAPTSLAGGAVAIGAVAVASRRTREVLTERQVPLAALTAAFVFAAQMLNFPVAGGTSGHLLGGVLAAVLVGPWVAVLCITVVLGVQALVFADGGTHRTRSQRAQHGGGRHTRGLPDLPLPAPLAARNPWSGHSRRRDRRGDLRSTGGRRTRHGVRHRRYGIGEPRLARCGHGRHPRPHWDRRRRDHRAHRRRRPRHTS